MSASYFRNSSWYQITSLFIFNAWFPCGDSLGMRLHLVVNICYKGIEMFWGDNRGKWKASSRPSFISCISTSKHLNSFISSVRQDALSMTRVELASVAHTKTKQGQTARSQGSLSQYPPSVYFVASFPGSCLTYHCLVPMWGQSGNETTSSGKHDFCCS